MFAVVFIGTVLILFLTKYQLCPNLAVLILVKFAVFIFLL